MRVALVIGMAFLLAACGEFMGAGVKHWRGPQGADTYALICSGVMVSMDTCVNKAKELCPKGYVTLDGGPKKEEPEQDERKRWLKAHDVNRHMTVECKQ